MKLTWEKGTGPGTTQELADEVEREGALGTGSLVTRNGLLRCLWGVIEDYRFDNVALIIVEGRRLSDDNRKHLIDNARCSAAANDNVPGTVVERCAEMVRRLRAIP